MLTWAREERGFDLDQAANGTEYDKKKISEWEESGELTFGQLKKVAKAYKRQTAVFFLQEQPQKVKLPKDKRNLRANGEKLHPDIMLAVRRTSWYLDFARNSETSEHWKTGYSWLNGNIPKNDTQTTTWLRKLLDVSIEKQKSFRNADDTFRFWRNVIEQKLGIFVFQFDMPEGEIDGFSYVEDGAPYAISINKNIRSNRKVFTIFHELAHIIDGQSDLCIVDAQSNQIATELACNKFAGDLLVPQSELVKLYNSKDIFDKAKELSVSSEVYLRRLYGADYLTEPQFDSLLAQIRKKVAETPKRKRQKGPPSQVNISKSVRGVQLFNLAIEAANTQRITTQDAANILGLSIQKVSEL